MFRQLGWKERFVNVVLAEESSAKVKGIHGGKIGPAPHPFVSSTRRKRHQSSAVYRKSAVCKRNRCGIEQFIRNDSTEAGVPQQIQRGNLQWSDCCNRIPLDFELHNVSILHHILLPFRPNPPFLARGGIAAGLHELIVMNDFCPDKPVAKIRVNRGSGVWGR